MLLTSCATSKPRLSAQEREPLPNGATHWTADVDAAMPSLIGPPQEIPVLSRIALSFADDAFGKELLPGRVLAWSTELGLASGALELYIEEGAAEILEPRLVYLLRMQVSFFVSCPFAIDVNSAEYRVHAITADEVRALQGRLPLGDVGSFSERERTALAYAVATSRTPVRFNEVLLTDLRRLFTHEELVAIAALSAKVNYWARFIEAMRIKPAGFTNDPLLDLGAFDSFETARAPSTRPGGGEP